MSSYFKKNLSKAEIKRLDKEWHAKICAKGVCQICKRWFPPEMVCGHHIKSKGSHPELRHDISNGICVCMKDHNDIHLGLIKL